MLTKTLLAFALGTTVALSGCTDQDSGDATNPQPSQPITTPSDPNGSPDSADAVVDALTDIRAIAASVDDALANRDSNTTRNRAISEGISDSDVHDSGAFSWSTNRPNGGYTLCYTNTDTNTWATYDSKTQNTEAGQGATCP